MRFDVSAGTRGCVRDAIRSAVRVRRPLRGARLSPRQRGAHRFALTGDWWLLVAAGTIGVISPSGHEVGPFLPIEQAALSQVVDDRNRTYVFAWYALAGSMATAFGALAAGTLARVWPQAASPTVDAYRAVVIVYASLGLALGILFPPSLTRRLKQPNRKRNALPRPLWPACQASVARARW